MLETLAEEPYEPLQLSFLRALSLKTALLLAVTSAKRVSESCAQEHKEFISVENDGWMHFCPPPLAADREATSHLLCPVQMLICYVESLALV